MRRHVHEYRAYGDHGPLDYGDPLAEWCPECGRLKADILAASRRARNNRSRGLAIQREANRKLGVSNIAGNAVNHDGGRHDEPFATESKSGASFSERYWRWLRAIPAAADQTAVLLVSDTPGPGRKRRTLVVLELGDFIDLHGELLLP